MPSFLSDEDLHGPIVDGLRLHYPGVDVVRAVEVGLGGLADDLLLSWAAQQGRVEADDPADQGAEAVVEGASIHCLCHRHRRRVA